MARAALKASDNADHLARNAKNQIKAKRRKQRDDLGKFSFAGKKFSELNNPAKDNLLKAIALHLNLIEPDDD